MAKWNLEKRSMQGTEVDGLDETNALQAAMDLENSEDAAAVGQELLASNDSSNGGKGSRKTSAPGVKAEKRSRKN